MANKANSLAHTKWMCNYHIIFTPKYRRKAIFAQYATNIGEILRKLCEYKGVELIEGRLMPGHAHMLVEIPPKTSVKLHGLSERQDRANDLRQTCQPEAQIWKQAFLGARLLCQHRYRFKEFNSVMEGY